MTSVSLRGDLVYNIGSQMLLRVVTAMTALYAARVFGPAEFGIWSVLQVAFMYTAQGHLGTVNAMMREVPLALARRDEEQAGRAANNTWSFVTSSSLLLAAVTGATVMFIVHEKRNGFLLAAGCTWLVVVQLQSVFFQFYCRAYSRFKQLASYSVVNACVLLPLSLYFIPRQGVAGYLFALSSGFTVIAIAVVTEARLKWQVSRREIVSLLRIGLPMLPGALMLYLNMSAERIVLASTVSAAVVGEFAAGAFFFQTGGTFFELVVYTWYARLAKMYGRTQCIESMVNALKQVLPGAIWVSSVAQGALMLILPEIIRRVLPRYTESIFIAQVLVIVTNLWGLTQLLNAALTITGRQKQSALLQASSLVLKGAIISAAALVYHSGAAVAVASAAALIANSMCAFAYWRRLVQVDLVSPVRGVALWACPGLAAAMCANADVSGMVRGGIYAIVAGAGTLFIHRGSQTFRQLYAWGAAR